MSGISAFYVEQNLGSRIFLPYLRSDFKRHTISRVVFVKMNSTKFKTSKKSLCQLISHTKCFLHLSFRNSYWKDKQSLQYFTNYRIACQICYTALWCSLTRENTRKPFDNSHRNGSEEWLTWLEIHLWVQELLHLTAPVHNYKKKYNYFPLVIRYNEFRSSWQCPSLAIELLAWTNMLRVPNSWVQPPGLDPMLKAPSLFNLEVKVFSSLWK